MTMSSHSSEDIASMLLHSSDARIAEAAKRVFSSTYPAVTKPKPNATAPPPVARPPHSYNPVEPPYHKNVGEMIDACGIPSAVGVPFRNPPEQPAFNPNPALPEVLASNQELSDDKDESDKKPSSTDRLQRSRERNRMHARKTRQRKKEHMQKLQNRADELKLEQIRLKQAINEKNTANILVGLFSTGDGSDNSNSAACDPEVEMLLKRPTEDIPDASKIPELPALILPGQHNGKKKPSENGEDDAECLLSSIPEEMQEDGIDYALLGKDRSACSPAELDQIRRERNRMHAKRTRDRKRIFMEEMEVMIKQLEEENSVLQSHVNKLNGGKPTQETASGASTLSAVSSTVPTTVISPELGPVSNPLIVRAPVTSGPGAPFVTNNVTRQAAITPPVAERQDPHTKGDFLNQIESLLAAAGAFEKRRSMGELNAVSCAESDVTASTNNSEKDSLCEEDDQLSGPHPHKKRRIHHSLADLPTSVPTSITTTNIRL